jgi:hypothetical protein
MSKNVSGICVAKIVNIFEENFVNIFLKKFQIILESLAHAFNIS